MFSGNDKKYVENAIVTNRAILFLGAGFSRLATNQLGRPLPLSAELAESIWKFLGYEGNYDGTPLTDLFEVLIKGGLRKRSEIKAFLESQLLCGVVPDSYNVVAIPFWYRIYTTNADDLLPQIYRRASMPRLRCLAYPRDYSAERDQSLVSIQAIYLNGRLPGDPEDLTFSFSQYAGAAASRHEPLYDQFVTDYSTHPTIFVGTQLNEPLFWQYIQARQRRQRESSERRPKSFLISKGIGGPRADALRTYNVTPIDATNEEFLSWLRDLSGRLPARLEVLKGTLPGLVQLIGTGDLAPRAQRDIEKFAIHFEAVPTRALQPRDRSAYLLGASPRWDDIVRDLDAPRETGTSLAEQVRGALSRAGASGFYTMHGSAGCGKSTILRRLGITLAREGHPVFLSNSEELPPAGVISGALESTNRRAVLLFDNAEVNLTAITSLAPALAAMPMPPIIVVAIRTNDFRRREYLFKDVAEHYLVSVPHLTRPEIVEVLQVLEHHSLLGRLRGMSEGQRIQEFESRAAKQILVAMREATSGRLFDDIIRDEFVSLDPVETKILYLCVALATDAGYRLVLEDFVGCAEVDPGDALELLEANLRDIVIRTGTDSRLLILRHRKIAEFMVDIAADRALLGRAYVRLLGVLAGKLREAPRRGSIFKLYRELINHYTISRRFVGRTDQARGIYDSLASRLQNDTQFWLQYGSLELQVDNLELAENYLNQADSLDPDNRYVQNALGLLLYRRAILASERTESEAYRATGRQRLQESMSEEFIRTSHPYHITLVQELQWILKWVRERQEQAALLSELRKVGEKARRLFPSDSAIDAAASDVERHYLMIAVD
jgi:tetratricopeptide (TPR) repeat protein